MAQNLTQALMGIPMLREMLGMQEFDAAQREREILNQGRIIDSAGKLAELQNAPALNEFRRAQAERARWEVENAKRGEARFREGYGRYMQPNVHSEYGPTLPGPPTREQRQMFQTFLQGDPSTVEHAVRLQNADALQNRRVGTPSIISRLWEEKRAAEEGGDPELAASIATQIKQREQWNPGDRRTSINRILELQGIADSRELTEPEVRELAAHAGNALGTRVHQLPTGQQVMIPGVPLPASMPFIERELTKWGIPIPASFESYGTPQTSGGQVQPGGPATAMPGPAPVRAAPGGVLPVPQGQGAKPLLPAMQKDFTEKGIKLKIFEALQRDFEDGFSPKGLRLFFGLGGKVAMELSRQGFTNEALADWWSSVNRIYAGDRHELFGATLTDNERKSFEELIALIGDSPQRIRAQLGQMIDTLKSEIQAGKSSASYGYNPKSISDALGEDQPNTFMYGNRAIKGEPREIEYDGKKIRALIKKDPVTRRPYTIINGQRMELR